MSQGSGFKLLPEKVLHRDIYIYPLNVATPTQPAISEKVMEDAVWDFNDKPMRFGEYDYEIASPKKSTLVKPINRERIMSRHITIDLDQASHIPRNVRVEDGWLMADIEVRPRTPNGQYLFKHMGDAYPARTPPEQVQNPFIFKMRYFVPNNSGHFLIPDKLVIVTIDCIPNPYPKAKDETGLDNRPEGA